MDAEMENNGGTMLYEWVFNLIRLLFIFTQHVKYMTRRIVDWVTNYGKIYEIRLTVVGMKNSGKSSFCKIVRSMETGLDLQWDSSDAVPTLKTQILNIRLNKGELNLNATSSSSGNISSDDLITNDSGKGTINLLGSYMRSLKGEASLKSMKGSNKNDQYFEETSPLLIGGQKMNYETDYCDSINKKVNSSHTEYSETVTTSDRHVLGTGNIDRANLTTGTPSTNKTMNNTNEQVIVKIHDLSGQARSHHLWWNYITSSICDCIIYIIDISDTLTLEESRRKLRELILYNNSHDRLPLLILGNKSDLVDWKRPFMNTNTNNKKKILDKEKRGRHEQLMSWLGLEFVQQQIGEHPQHHLHPGTGNLALQGTLLRFELVVFVVSLQNISQAEQSRIMGWALGAGACVDDADIDLELDVNVGNV